MSKDPFGRSRLFARRVNRGVLPLVVLRELDSHGPVYGYRLIRSITETTGGGIPSGPSSIYPALRTLRLLGYAVSFHGREAGGPVRRYYRITERGRRALHEALATHARVGASLAGPSGPRARPARGSA